MSIAEGDALPALPIRVVENGEARDSTPQDLFGQGRHVIFGLPGAFTPTCSAKHLPGFAGKLNALKSRGVGRVACLAVNDAFVMKAWNAQQGAPGLTMIADGNADLTQALGMAVDATANHMGLRCRRFAMIVQDGTVSRLMVEQPGDFSVSSAEHVLGQL